MVPPFAYPAALVFCFAAGLASASGFGYQRSIGWMLPILALAVLFALCQTASSKRAGWLAFCFGLGHFGLGVSWTFNSLHVYGYLPAIVAGALAGLLAIYLASFYALAGWLGRRGGATGGGTALVRLVAAWVIVEHLRSWLFGGFGWLAAGYAQVPYSPLTGYIPLLGTFGATALCAVSATLIVAALDAPTNRRALLPALLLTLLAGGGMALRLVDFTVPAGPPLKISLLQGAIRQDEQWLRSNLARVPRIYFDLIQRSAGNLLIAPESAFPFQWSELPAEIRQSFRSQLALQKATLVAGTFDRDPDSGRSRNAALVLHADDTQWYAKRHLTPYGEYLPFAQLLEPILQRQNIPYSQLTPGEDNGLLEVPGVVLSMTICYESLFPALFAAPPAQLLVTITNDSWFDGTGMPRQHLQIAAARALEFGRWMARASNTGPSALIDPHGFVRRWQAALVRGVTEGEAIPMRGQTPYFWLGDWPTLVAAIAALLLRRRQSIKYLHHAR